MKRKKTTWQMILVFLRALTTYLAEPFTRREYLFCLTVSEMLVVETLEEEGKRKKEVEK